MHYEELDEAYIILNNIRIKPVSVIFAKGGFVTIRVNGGAIRVREDRLYRTEEEAQKELERIRERKAVKGMYEARWKTSG